MFRQHEVVETGKTMQKLRLRGVAGGVLTLVLTSCGGSGPSGPAPGGPVIANPQVTNGAACPIQGISGSAQVLRFDFSDIDGNVRGGTVLVTNTSSRVTVSTSVGPPGLASITGTTSGTICVFVGFTQVTVSVVLVDVAGARSNELRVAL